MNSFGKNLRVTTFGESHAPAIGGVIDGFPAGFKIDFQALMEEVAKRSPGSSQLVTQRKETDQPEFLSGISEEGITYGTPIGFIIRNKDNRGRDYSEVAEKYRPNHADFTYDAKFGIRDYKGGGRASARETANWVVAGALASQWLKQKDIHIESFLSGVGEIDFSSEFIGKLSTHPDTAIEVPSCLISKMEEEILKAKNSGDSVGGTVSCIIRGLMPGLGEPVFDKFHSRLAQAMMSINAAKGFEYGIGFKASQAKGSEIADIFYKEDNKISTYTNYSGGVQGGITNGMPVFFNVFLKPTPTIMTELPTITNKGEKTTLKMKGRHDPCVAVRAVPVVKALTALVVADFLL